MPADPSPPVPALQTSPWPPLSVSALAFAHRQLVSRAGPTRPFLINTRWDMEDLADVPFDLRGLLRGGIRTGLSEAAYQLRNRSSSHGISCKSRGRGRHT